MTVTDIIKDALDDAGCTLILYESANLSDIAADQSKQNDIIGMILEPASITFELKGNGVHHYYPPIVVEIIKPVKPEDTAENNDATFNEIIEITDKFIMYLIHTGSFKKINSFTADKINENKYDANVIGLSLPLNLFLIENKDNC